LARRPGTQSCFGEDFGGEARKGHNGTAPGGDNEDSGSTAKDPSGPTNLDRWEMKRHTANTREEQRATESMPHKLGF
jgi:hypothetical protein